MRLARVLRVVHAELDRRLEVDLAVVVGHADFGDRSEHAADRTPLLVLLVLAARVRTLAREVVEAENDVLRRHDDRLAVRGAEDVVGRHHQHARFHLRFDGERHVDGHLVTVEVGVERRLHTSGWSWIAFPSVRTGSNAWIPMRCSVGSAVQQNRVLLDDFFEDVPHLYGH